MNTRRGPNCLRCEYFYVTWDPSFPRGCRVFGIKSRQIPSIEVKKATGKQCPSFKESSRLKK
ncbi:uracil-DNA glycosylase [Oceanispirochaeta crateris]|uniref:Uracil-DNA glycosylase n=1 Tax=Oceanispirochaeta crateris TaxID=2518645 RepID=A0A5C1QMI4_9SPIO|nr:uracil-DNA glycosylase [Oceanispirochaeta crateris]